LAIVPIVKYGLKNNLQSAPALEPHHKNLNRLYLY
jgi:hypothetical protein